MLTTGSAIESAIFSQASSLVSDDTGSLAEQLSKPKEWLSEAGTKDTTAMEDGKSRSNVEIRMGTST